MLGWRSSLPCLHTAPCAPREIEVLFPCGQLLLFLVLALDREQFDFKDEGCVGANVGALAAFTVREVRGDEELPLRSHGHELKRFRPALDHSAYWKGCGLTALVRAVEFLAVDEGAAIVADHGVAGCGLRAGARG